jgi:hypothetical protein
MRSSLEHFVDPSIPGLSGRDLIAGLSGGKPFEQARWTSLRHLGDHLLHDLGLERRARRSL